MDVIVEWTRDAKRSYHELLGYLQAQPYGDAPARGREIQAAIEGLRRAPYGCAVLHVRAGRNFRRLVVKGRFLVYYVYFPPRPPQGRGRISIRAVKNSARKRPFAGVREPEPAQYGAGAPSAELL